MHLQQQQQELTQNQSNNLIEKDIPEQTKNLQDNVINLEKVAQYCEDIYVNSRDTQKQHLLNETKGYTTQALASVAYQIHVLANSFLQLLENQSILVEDMSVKMSHLSHEVAIHKEKVARREIGILTTNKCVMRTLKVKRPEVDEKPVKYVRKPIDYSCLDDVGHGVKLTRQSSNPLDPLSKIGVGRQNSYSSTHSASSLSAAANNNNKSMELMMGSTPPMLLKAAGNGLGTVRSNASNSVLGTNVASNGNTPSSSSYYRQPVAPPSVPSEYLSRQELGIYSSKKELNQSNNIYSDGGMSISSAYGYQRRPSQSSTNNNSLSLTNNQGISEYSADTMGRHLSYASGGGANNHLMMMMINNANNPTSSVGYATGSSIGIIRTNLNNIDYATSGTMYRRPQLHPSLYEPNQPPRMTSSSLNNQVMQHSDSPNSKSQIHKLDFPAPNAQYDEDDDDDTIIPNWVPLEKCLEKCLTTYDYDGTRDDELSFKENMFIYVIKKNDDLWYEGIMKNENGEICQGLFPYNYAKCVRKYAEESRIIQC